MRDRMRLLLSAIAVSAVGLCSSSYAASSGSSLQETAPQTAVKAHAQDLGGQSLTLMPDGRLLMIGGIDNGVAVKRALLRSVKTGAVATPSGSPTFARAFHSATLLPNGKVLIFGGTGKQDAVVETSEIFDPVRQTFTKISVLGIVARAHHTATLLADSRVLIAGGVDTQGHAVTRIDLWDYRTGLSTALPVELHSGRIGNTAVLQSDGTVLLSGGHDENGSPLRNSEIIDPNGPSVRLVTNPIASSSSEQAPAISATVPQSGETGTPTDQVVSVLFSEPMNVTTLNTSTVTLRTFTGAVSINVVPAEGGILLFVTPQSPLENDTSYTLSVSGATDSTGHVLPDSTVVFTTVASDTSVNSTGTASSTGVNGAGWQAGIGTPGVGSGPSTPWRKLPMLPAPVGVTALAGQVLKLDGTPLPNVLLEIGSHHATTDNTGRFLIQDLGPGHRMMLVDGGPASTESGAYGTQAVRSLEVQLMESRLI
ncbi:MAG: kelch repeat-containing protein [Terracidiphilus sp.]